MTKNIQWYIHIYIYTFKEHGSSHFYASIGTCCVQIGQLLEAQRVFEKCMKTAKSLFSKENYVDIEFFRKFKVSSFYNDFENSK